MMWTAGPGCPNCGGEGGSSETEHVMKCSRCGHRWQSSWWWAHMKRRARAAIAADGSAGAASSSRVAGGRREQPTPTAALGREDGTRPDNGASTGNTAYRAGRGEKEAQAQGQGRDAGTSATHGGTTTIGQFKKREEKRKIGEDTDRRFPDIGIKPATHIEPATFHAWLRTDPEPDPRTAQSRETAGKKMEEWGINRVLRHETQPVVCIARAARRVRDWRKEGKGNGTKCAETGEYKKQPPVRLAQQLVHWTILPTAVANDADRYYLPVEGRHFTTDEICDAFGVAASSTLRAALKKEATPTQATQIMGAAIHVPTAVKILRAGLEKAGMHVGQHSERIKLYDTCSGVSTVAEAMEQITGGEFEYVGAAEQEPVQRGVLEHAWAHRGLTRACIYKDAYGPEAEEGPQGERKATVYFMTPDCSKWSQNTNGAPTAEARAETEKVAQMMRYAREARPALVVLESVADLLGPARIRECGRLIERHLREALPDYGWYSQAVDAYTHGGVPMRRDRAFWMGIRPATPTRAP